MPKLTIPCAKCGSPVEVDETTIHNAVLLGVSLSVEHADGECPGDPARPVEDGARHRRFRLQLIACEIPNDPEEIAALGIHTAAEDEAALQFPAPVYAGVACELFAGTGTTVEAENFATAVNGAMTAWLDKSWRTLQETAAYADLPDPTPAPAS